MLLLDHFDVGLHP